MIASVMEWQMWPGGVAIIAAVLIIIFGLDHLIVWHAKRQTQRNYTPCVEVECPPVEESPVTLRPITYATTCWDNDDDGQCPQCVSPPGDRFAICPRRGVFG